MPFNVLDELRDGSLAAAEWLASCTRLEIADAPLVARAEA